MAVRSPFTPYAVVAASRARQAQQQSTPPAAAPPPPPPPPPPPDPTVSTLNSVAQAYGDTAQKQRRGFGFRSSLLSNPDAAEIQNSSTGRRSMLGI